MYATFYVECDEKFQELCFMNLEVAERFRQFVLNFMTECPATKVSGYRLMSRDITEVKNVPNGAVTNLDDNACSSMLAEIVTARLAGDQPNSFIFLEVGSFNGAISFRCDPLPMRQRPTVGDRAVITNPDLLEDGMTPHCRVYCDHGHALTVYPEALDEEAYPRPGTTKFRRVPVESIMKVSDRHITPERARRIAAKKLP